MEYTKANLRGIVLENVFAKDYFPVGAKSFDHLVRDVITKLGPDHVPFTERERMLLLEIFWDLVTERILTPGPNSDQDPFPWFHIHSEAVPAVASR